MATSDLAPPRDLLQSTHQRSHVAAQPFALTRILSVLASLRLTVVLFALSIILIFLGTLAQKDNDVWKVVNDTYFRVWFAHVDFQVFERLAQLFFKTIKWDLSGWFPFFGGKTLGLCLLVNLLAAHAIRFKIAAQGQRLWIGLTTLVVGIIVTYFAISTGSNEGIASELSAEFCDYLWQGFRALLALTVLGGAYLLFFWGQTPKLKLIEWRVLLAVDILLAVLTVWLLAHPEARLDNAGIRILWQLAKGSAAGLALLVGCVMVFRKRAGIVLLHSGVALIMLTELFTAVAAVESQMVDRRRRDSQIFERYPHHRACRHRSLPQRSRPGHRHSQKATRSRRRQRQADRRPQSAIHHSRSPMDAEFRDPRDEAG